ncbi:MAG: pantetheine-phosphate adenylyltransferase [Lachnospiraceae bacterium]|nr:pantetheine-phosphate adenylyltransferase [Lachnospiraceae bacterium]
MSKAMYPGSFDPVTIGHLDIIKRAAKTFDELVVGVLNNKQKSPLFSVEERVKILKEATKDIPNITVVSFSGLMADYAKENGITVSVRGIRNGIDLDAELVQAQYNRLLSGDKLETVSFFTRPEYSFISSSGVREVAMFGGDLTPYVPEFVAKLVEEKINDKK